MKFFLDCGAHDGSSVRRFRSLYPDWPRWQVHCWEPNPVHGHKILELDGVILHEQAVWIEDGRAPFYLHKGGKSKAGSLISTKPDLDLECPVMVPCVDFSGWLKVYAPLAEYIVLKMDIEGAEYLVLPKMIADGSIDYVDELYVEFHGEKTGISPEEHESLTAELWSIGLGPKPWHS